MAHGKARAGSRLHKQYLLFFPSSLSLLLFTSFPPPACHFSRSCRERTRSLFCYLSKAALGEQLVVVPSALRRELCDQVRHYRRRLFLPRTANRQPPLSSHIPLSSAFGVSFIAIIILLYLLLEFIPGIFADSTRIVGSHLLYPANLPASGLTSTKHED